MNEKKQSYRHLTFEERRLIERYLNEGATLTRISKDIGFSTSSIKREILRNRRFEGASRIKGADSSDCEYFIRCKLKCLCMAAGQSCITGGSKLCKRCFHVNCENICADYKPRTCKTVISAPHICNACPRYHRCTIERYRYSAQSAQATSERRRSEARNGFDLSEAEVKHLINTVRAGFTKGHSINHIFATHEMPCSERTFYRLVENQDIAIIGMELPKKCKYKKRKTRREPSRPRGFYLTRQYSDFRKLDQSARCFTTEIDTVFGKKGDKKCILSIHRRDLHFQIYLLLQERTTAQVVRAFDWLEMCCEDTFSELFGLLLADRGSEFDDYLGIEGSDKDDEKRTRIYYTDPYNPGQKGACEKNHVELRKIIPKGTSLDELTSYQLAEICSHVNSTPRKSLGNTSPLQLAQLCMPEALFENLGLEFITPNDVISTPGILYSPSK
jgi:IS30 family transposase